MIVVAPKTLMYTAGAGLVAGLLLATDSAAVDLPGTEHPLPNTLGVLVPLTGVLLLVGLYIAVRTSTAGPGRLLDWGFVLNTFGLVLVGGIDFARSYVLSELSDDQVEALLESGPTLPAFMAAGTAFTAGALLFGAALVRAGYGGAAWLYTLTAVPSGFSALLPDIAAALAQLLMAGAIIWLSLGLRARVAALPPSVAPSPRPAVPS